MAEPLGAVRMRQPNCVARDHIQDLFQREPGAPCHPDDATMGRDSDGDRHQPFKERQELSTKRPWRCPEERCGKAFQRNSGLDRHRFTRTELSFCSIDESLMNLEQITVGTNPATAALTNLPQRAYSYNMNVTVRVQNKNKSGTAKACREQFGFQRQQCHPKMPWKTHKSQIYNPFRPRHHISASPGRRDHGSRESFLANAPPEAVETMTALFPHPLPTRANGYISRREM
jgi:hypothetical protein